MNRERVLVGSRPGTESIAAPCLGFGTRFMPFGQAGTWCFVSLISYEGAMRKTEPWFYRERALALASLLLTSRTDVAVQHADGSTGMDIVAEVLKNAERSRRFFGVQVRGVKSLPSNGHVRFSKMELSAMPVCAFLYDVRKNAGVFRWLAEPIVEAGEPKLIELDHGAWSRLDESALDKIVAAVARWYEALVTRLRA